MHTSEDPKARAFLEPSRVYCYGYRSREIRPLSEMDLPLSSDAKISVFTNSDPLIRKPVQVSLGCHLEGHALPHVDPDDLRTVLDGVKKRFTCEMPPPMKGGLRRRFRRFVSRWCTKNLTPLAADSDTSVPTWLETTNYPEWRKQQLTVKFLKIVNKFDPKYYDVKSFVKDETYPDYKMARGINSRSDEFKCLVGPIFRLIEKQLFAKEYFIKKIPVRDRPQYIMDHLQVEGNTYMLTDFTTYEAHFGQLMEDCEMLMYEYMVQYLPEGPDFMRLLSESMLSINKCIFKMFTVKVWRRRMSGEMCTSLGNGFTNLMLIMFLFEESGLPEPKICVEGDDGITSFKGERPSDSLILTCGLKLKLEEVDDVCLASFCGQVFDCTDKLVVTDPMVAAASFGWTIGKYANAKDSKLKGLLRSKSYSLIYSYPGCPILASLGRYGLRMTEGFRALSTARNEYEREEFQIMMKAVQGTTMTSMEIPMNTRELVDRLYGISVQEQFEIEKYLDELDQLMPISHNALCSRLPKVWSHYWEHYATPVPKSTPKAHLFPEWVSAGATFSGMGESR